MEGGLLRLHFLDQFINAIDGASVRDGGRQSAIMVNLAVNLDALLADDFVPGQAGENRATCQGVTRSGPFGCAT